MKKYTVTKLPSNEVVFTAKTEHEALNLAIGSIRLLGFNEFSCSLLPGYLEIKYCQEFSLKIAAEQPKKVGRPAAQEVFTKPKSPKTENPLKFMGRKNSLGWYGTSMSTETDVQVVNFVSVYRGRFNSGLRGLFVMIGPEVTDLKFTTVKAGDYATYISLHGGDHNKAMQAYFNDTKNALVSIGAGVAYIAHPIVNPGGATEWRLYGKRYL